MRKTERLGAPAHGFSKTGDGAMKRILVSVAVLALLAGAAQAHRTIMEGHTQGKIALIP